MNMILEDLKAQREGLLALGFWALLVFRFGHARLAIRNKIVRAPWTIVYLILNKLVEIFCGITIGASANIGRRLTIEHHGGIVIHGATRMGNDCMIRHGVTIGNSGRSDPFGAPDIGDRVEIGAGAKILGRIRIGNDAIIGANAVVTRDVPENAVVGGVPARIIRMRSTPEPGQT
jgi:serine O-acetyltransferase